jgi:hypothetical protein
MNQKKNKLEKLIGTKQFKSLPVSIQIIRAKRLNESDESGGYFSKVAGSDFHQTAVKPLIYCIKPISKIYRPVKLKV